MPNQSPVATLVDPRDAPAVRRARDLRRVALAGLGLVLLLGLSGLLGIRSSTTSARSPEGTALTVEHAQVTRAGIAAPFHVTVRRPGGFPRSLTLRIDSDLPERFDFQNFYPNPAAETATRTHVLYEFDPPPGDVFRLSLDARTAPDQNGSTAVYDVGLLDGDRLVATVSFRMWVMP